MIENKRMTNFLGVVMLLGLFLPHSSTLLIAINPLLLLILYYYNRKNVFKSGMDTIKLLICIVVFLSFFHSFLSTSHVTNKYIQSSIFLILLVLFFPFVGSSKIPSSFFFVSILYILFTQLIYLFNLPSLQRTLELVYPVDELTENSFRYMTENISTNNIFSFRLGGLFRNPNQCARYVCLITAVYLADRADKSLRHIRWFVLLSLGSVLLTGSRTGIVVFSLITIVFIIQNRSIKQRKKALVLFFLFLLIIPSFFTGSSLFRGFNVSQGIENSANVKWYVLMDYLSQNNSAFHLLFGHGDVKLFQPSQITTLPIFDSEYGEVIYTYGFVGLILICLFYVKAIRHSIKECRLYFIILFWAVSSTILMSYRMSFLFMFFLSHIVSVQRSSYNAS